MQSILKTSADLGCHNAVPWYISSIDKYTVPGVEVYKWPTVQSCCSIVEGAFTSQLHVTSN